GEFWPQFLLACCAYHRRDHDEAAVGFSVCIGLAPRSPECYFNRAPSEAARGRVEAAPAAYGRAPELNPDLAAPAFTRAVLFPQAGRPGAARADLDRVLRLRPDHPEARKLLRQLPAGTQRAAIPVVWLPI